MTQPPPPEHPFGDPSGYRQYGPTHPRSSFGPGYSYGQQWAPNPNTSGLRPLIDDPYGPDAPLPQAAPGVALGRFWRRALVFSGRASRSEFWWAAALNVAIVYVLSTVAYLSGSAPGWDLLSGPLLSMAFLYSLAAILPAISVLVRRLHDSGSSGLVALFSLVPYLGTVVVLVFTLLGSQPEGARFDRINRR